MEDRELLEMAAKAIGIHATYLYGQTFGINDCMVFDDWKIWNPLGNDGDAFRAANAKGISVIHEYPGYVLAKRLVGGEWFKAFVNEPNDYDRAARMAIVYVLAEIGKKMP